MERQRELAADAWSALAASLVVLPQSVAFGVAIYAALGPSYAAYGALSGFIGAAVLGLCAATLGGAPRLISAPCAPAAAVLAPLVAVSFAAGRGPEEVMLLLLATAALAGLLQMLYGGLGAGRLIKYIPYPVVTGYLSGVAALIVIGQGPCLLGLPKGTGLLEGLLHPEAWRWEAVFVGGATMAAMLAGPRLTRKVPAAVLGVAAGGAAYGALALARPELRQLAANPFVVGTVGGQAAGFGLWTDLWPRLSVADIRAALAPALTLSILLTLDTLKTCVVLDALTRGRHRSGRELFAQGLGNLLSGLAGGAPGAGSMAPTLVNVSSGGRTAASGALCAAFAAAGFLLLGRAVAWLPLASLAGLLVVLAGRMVDWGSFRLLRQRSTALDFAVAAAVVAVAVASGLIMASGVGLALAVILFIRDQTHSSVVRRRAAGGEVFSRQKRLPAEAEALAKEGGRIVVFELQGSLFFGTADHLYERACAELEAGRYLLLDLRRVLSVDFTAAHVLELIAGRLAERGGRLLLSGMPKASPTGQDLRLYLAQLGLTASERVHVFASLDEALAWAEDRILAKSPPGEGPVLELAQIDVLRGLEPALLSVLGSCVRERSLSAGEALFAQGQAADGEMFFVRQGRVRVELGLGDGGRRHLATFSEGDFFGEMAFLDGGTRSASATAAAPTRLFCLSRADFDRAAPGQPELGRKFFDRLARSLAFRLRQADAEIRALHEA